MNRMPWQGIGRVLLALAGVCAGAAQAADVHITAEFKPDLADPGQRTFVNTTPRSGVCANAHLQTCIQNDWWSIDTTLRGTKDAVRAADYGPDGFYIAMPPPRTVTVVSEDGSSTFDLTLRIIGSALRFTDEERDGPGAFWSTGAPRGCTQGISGHAPHTVMRMLLRRDGGQGRAACALHWVETNNYDIAHLDFIYALETPAPLGMRSGVYTGTTVFTYGGTGEAADFDLGHRVALDDRVVNVHFRLEVRHAFQLLVPPGSHVAQLSPKGGWTQWTDHGVVPTVLERELPFSLSSSGRFSVQLQCQYPQQDGRCALRNTSVEAADAPLDVSVTLPGFREVGSGVEAVAMPLLESGDPPVLTADAVIIGRPARLRFAVTGEPVKAMLQHPGTRYRGDVTVVFDADP